MLCKRAPTVSGVPTGVEPGVAEGRGDRLVDLDKGCLRRGGERKGDGDSCKHGCWRVREEGKSLQARIR